MRFTPPPRNPNLPYALLNTQPLDQGLANVGNALAERRVRMQNEELGQAAKESGLEGLRDAAYGAGRIGVGLQAGNALANRKHQQDSLALRKQRMAQSGGQGRVMNVGGNLVRVGADGRPEVLYTPPQNGIDQQLKQARLKKLQQGDPLKQLKAKVLQQLLGPGQQKPAQAEPQVQLQSGEVTTTDPNLIQAQTAQQAPAAPQQSNALANLTPEQRKAMALNLVSPGLGNPILQAQKGEQFGKPAKNKIEEKIFNSEEAYSRIIGLRNEFKPVYQTLQGKLKHTWLAIKEKLQLGTLSPEDEDYLSKISVFRSNAARHINDYIKEITGAQMSEAEADRIRRGVADPGDGLLDGDSPTEYLAKTNAGIESIVLSRMRYHYMRSGGWNGTQMSPEDIGKIMKRKNVPVPLSLPRMRSIFNNRVKQLQKSGMQRPQAIGKAKQEFGI